MHLYKQFWRLLGKNKSSLTIYGIIAVVMIGLVAMMTLDKEKGNEEDTANPSLAISYVDQDHSVLSKGLVEFCSTNYTCTDLEGKTEEQINDLLYFTITKFHMTIPENFQQQLNEGKDVHVEYAASAAEASYSNACAQTIDRFVNSYLSYKNLGMSDDEAVRETTARMSEKPEMKTYTEGEKVATSTPAERMIYQLTLYLFYISFGVICLTAGMAIVKTNETLVKKRVDAAPVSAEKITMANTMGIYSFGLLLGIVFSVAILIAGWNSEIIMSRGWLVCLGVLIMIITNCSVTVMISSFGPKSNTMSMVVNVVGLSSCFLGGVFVPQWLLSKEVLAVGKFLPSYWFTYALNMCFPNSGAGLPFEMTEVMKCYGVELLFAMVFVTIAIVVKRARAQR